jgi:hypothetical protein
VVGQIKIWKEVIARDFKVILSQSEDKITAHATKAYEKAEVKLQSLVTSPHSLILRTQLLGNNLLVLIE